MSDSQETTAIEELSELVADLAARVVNVENTVAATAAEQRDMAVDHRNLSRLCDAVNNRARRIEQRIERGRIRNIVRRVLDRASNTLEES